MPESRRSSVDENRILNLIREEFKKFKDSFVEEITVAVTTSVKKEMEELHRKIDEQEREIDILKRALIRSEESRLIQRRQELSSNVILRGVPEDADEKNNKETLEKVKNLLFDVLPDIDVIKADRLVREQE